MAWLTICAAARDDYLLRGWGQFLDADGGQSQAGQVLALDGALAYAGRVPGARAPIRLLPLGPGRISFRAYPLFPAPSGVLLAVNL
jgi:hypothetical protein